MPRCPNEAADHGGADHEEGDEEGDEEGETRAEGSLGTGSQALCEQLANTYSMITEAHTSCSTDADCRVYPEVGLCGGTLDTKLPREELEQIHGLQVGYACPMPMAKCMPPPDKAVCVANACERG